MYLQKAKELLETGAYTCVLLNDTTQYTSTLRGVKPLVEFLEAKSLSPGLSAADKVVGKATAYLYVLLQIKDLYANVISEPAIEVLETYKIAVQYKTKVPHIINRKGDGFCPFESAVIDIHTPEHAYTAIKQKMKELNITLE